MLLEECNQLLPKLNRESAKWVLAACYLMISSETIGNSIESQIGFIQCKDKLNAMFDFHSKDHENDILALTGVLAMLWQHPEFCTVFYELCETKRIESVQWQDSEAYIERLAQLERLGRRMEDYATLETFELALIELAKQTPVIANAFKRSTSLKI